MKKHIAFLICLMMILSLASCKSNEDQDTLSRNENNDTAPSVSIESDNTSTQISDAEKAMKMYEAAIKGEICVLDEHLGEIKLKDCLFPSNNLRLGECEILSKAILDIDGDGINEYVIQSPDNEHIILRYYNAKIYSYCLDSSDFYKFNTDGTFYWCNSPYTEYGLSKIIFDGEGLNVRSLYSLKYVDTAFEYYIEEELATEDEYYIYRDEYYPKQEMRFSYFELTRSYPITADQAWELANAYWDDQDGSRDAAAGTRWTARIVLIDTPNADTNYYRVAFQVERSSGGGMVGHECLPPFDIKSEDQIQVNAFTGEIIASTHEQNVKDISLEEVIEIAQNYESYMSGEICNEENGYRVEHIPDAKAPDHVYVIIIRKYDTVYSRIWIDKSTGKTISPYYLEGKG